MSMVRLLASVLPLGQSEFPQLLVRHLLRGRGVSHTFGGLELPDLLGQAGWRLAED